MDARDTARRLAEERELLGKVAEALRYEIARPVTQDSRAARRRQLDFLLDILQRHAARVFALSRHQDCLQFAVEWGAGDGGPERTVDPVALAHDLEGILADTRDLADDDGEEIAPDRERWAGFLARLEDYLHEERSAWRDGLATPIGV